jgi:hypothetical protein
MDSEGLIVLIWIASTPKIRMVQHFLLKLVSEKNYCTATLKRVKSHRNQVKFHLHWKNETIKLIAKG